MKGKQVYVVQGDLADVVEMLNAALRLEQLQRR